MSDGVLVEASVIARLFGVKLLRLNAWITLMPAHFEPIPQAQPVKPFALDGRRIASGGSLDEATDLLQRASQTIREAKRTGTL